MSSTGHFKGVVPGLVKSLKDPEGIGRLQVQLPRLPGQNRTFWASVAAPMAGKKRGFFFQPELDDEVLVAFEEGDPQHPYIIGFLWNGVDNPPDGINSSEDSVRRLRTVSGHMLEFDDTSNKEAIRIKTQGGHHIEMDDEGAKISIETKGGQKITMKDSPQGRIEVATKNQLTITLDDSGAGSITLSGGGRMLTMQNNQLQIT